MRLRPRFYLAGHCRWRSGIARMQGAPTEAARHITRECARDSLAQEATQPTPTQRVRFARARRRPGEGSREANYLCGRRMGMQIVLEFIICDANQSV